jgi:hypothetical protein
MWVFLFYNIMAEDKKGVLVYADWMKLFEALEDDEAGKLIKHFFRYINDLDPKAPDRVTELSFISIEQTLKRDLKKWDKIRVKRSEAGIKSAEVRANKREQEPTNSTSVKSVEDISTNSTVRESVSVSVNESDNVNDIKKEKKVDVFNFRKSLISNGGNESLVIEWMQVRKNGKATNTETALKGFLNQVKLSKVDINEVLKQCVESSWKGFKADWIKEVKVKDQIPEEPDMSWYNEWKRSPEDRKAANKKWVDLGYRPKNKTTSVGVITTWHKQQPVN